MNLSQQMSPSRPLHRVWSNGQIFSLRAVPSLKGEFGIMRMYFLVFRLKKNRRRNLWNMKECTELNYTSKNLGI